MSLHQIKAKLCSAWGSDKAAAHSAWASTYDFEKLEEKTEEDIRRIASNIVTLVHDTPKERVWMEFFITCPIFVERQLDKYRMTQQYQDIRVEYNFAKMGRDHITQNELSGRYKTIPDRFYGLPDDVLEILQKTAVVVAKEEGATPSTVEDVVALWNEAHEAQRALYEDALKGMRKAESAGAISNAEYKRAREVVRGVLGTSYLTDMRYVMNANAFEHVVNQRIDAHAQLESQVTAYRMLVEARDNLVAKTVIETMIEHNKWQPRMDLIAAILEQESLDV